MRLHQVMTMNDTPVLVRFIARHIIYKLGTWCLRTLYGAPLCGLVCFQTHSKGYISYFCRSMSVSYPSKFSFIFDCTCMHKFIDDVCDFVEVLLMHHIIRSMVKVIPEYVFSSLYFSSSCLCNHAYDIKRYTLLYASHPPLSLATFP